MQRKKYSTEFIVKIAKENLFKGTSPGQLAEQYRIDHGTIRDWITQYKENGASAFYSEEHNRVYSEEGQEIIGLIRSRAQGDELDNAMRKAIEYRKRCIENSAMSMSDYALSKLIDIITEKVNGIDTSMLNDDTVKLLGEAASKVNEHDFAMKVIDGLGERGYLPKVKNRATRRKKKEE